MLVALAIISLLAAIALPQFNQAWQRQKLNSEARHLAGDLRLARQEAITTGKSTWVEFYYFENCYKVQNKARHYFPTGISYAGKPSIKEENDRIRCYFNSSGVPIGAGTVSLTNQNHDIKYVIVNLPAGRVRISDSPPEE